VESPDRLNTHGFGVLRARFFEGFSDSASPFLPRYETIGYRTLAVDIFGA